MSGNRGCFFNSLLFLVLVLVPVVGHIIETVMVLEDDHTPVGKLIWLLIIWCLPIIGVFLYMFFGQRGPQRVMFGRPSYADYNYNQSPYNR